MPPCLAVSTGPTGLQNLGSSAFACLQATVDGGNTYCYMGSVCLPPLPSPPSPPSLLPFPRPSPRPSFSAVRVITTMNALMFGAFPHSPIAIVQGVLSVCRAQTPPLQLHTVACSRLPPPLQDISNISPPPHPHHTHSL